ncbi:hypothetical protein HYX70_00560 [Candidatus Saccharibacteria bacterium]|nr:hypothetical protein [Candidatus Saccharibacteria bacterium]
MIIRPAEAHDVDHIQALHDKYVLDVTKSGDPAYGAEVQQRGFTVSAEEASAGDRMKISKLLRVAEEDGDVVGYIDISKEEYFPEDADNIEWFSKDLKNIYYNDDTALTLHHIASER